MPRDRKLDAIGEKSLGLTCDGWPLELLVGSPVKGSHRGLLPNFLLFASTVSFLEKRLAAVAVILARCDDDNALLLF